MHTDALHHRLRTAVRDVPNFPRDGVLFRDVTPLLADGALFEAALDRLMTPWTFTSIDAVAGVESRGFVFGAAVAARAGVGMHLLRKPGKLPPPVASVPYVLEYGVDALQLRPDVVPAGSRVLLVDDVLATGGTAAAAVRLLTEAGATVVGAAFFLELEALGGRDALRAAGIPVTSVLTL